MTINQLPEIQQLGTDASVPISFNDADYKLPLGNFFFKTTMTATTGADGNVTTPFLYADYIVIAAVRTDALNVTTRQVSITTHKWIINFKNASGTSLVANTSVTFDVYAIPRSVFKSVTL